MTGDPLTLQVDQIASALRSARFDPQHAGALFLRADAEQALKAVTGPGARVYVGGRDDAQMRGGSFLGASFRPDLVVEFGPQAGGGLQRKGGERVAVALTLLRSDAGPVPGALAGALAMAQRYAAVIALILDRRVERGGLLHLQAPFDEPAHTGSGGESSGMSPSERALVDRLWTHHRVRVVVRKQDPFGF